ncbi:uncharacterized protein LOC131529985 [Onychostoma macrolepis]|uniref:uncharacterized protein LOC131529985 n=1 Tax=Onychostoma macrolepis TaxID=369639 RepID=UPI00272B6E7B|nr:uncharacterized protein LOC131529985 [Onychostoma macrolepis]
MLLCGLSHYHHYLIDDAEKWFSTESQVSCSAVDENVHQNDINPEDSVSDISRESSKPASKRSWISVRSGRSSASSARVMAAADKTALIARATALKEKHSLELQQEKLRHRREQLDIDAEIAAAAKIAVLNNSNHQSLQTCTDDMNVYYDKGTVMSGKEVTLNPRAEEYMPKKTSQQGGLRNVIRQTHSAPQIDHNSASPVQTSNVMQNIDGTSTSNICSVMQKQNEITALLVEQQQSSTLPQRDIPVFDGNPLQYRAFIRAFEHGIEDQTKHNRDCLYFLEQYTRGQPRELVHSCHHMDAQRGYLQAKALLKEHFGKKLIIWRSWRCQAI